VLRQIIKNFLLLEAGMQFQFTGRRLNTELIDNGLQFGNRHIGNADMPDQPFLHKRFTLSVCIHEFFHRKRFGIRIPGIHTAVWRMIIRERPVDIKQIDIITL
jgi:hypothetical protein